MSCISATPVDLDIDQGADATIPVVVTGLSLTGATSIMQARDDILSPTVVLEMSTANGKITISGTTISVKIPKAETSLLTKPLVYDLFVTTQDNLTYKLLRGKLIPVPSVTR